RDPVDRRRWWRRRRRRVLGVLAVLCLTEATGAVLLGPGFLAGLTASLTLFLWYAAVLRNRVLVAQRHRRHQARIAARHAAAGAADRRIAAEKQRRIAEARRAAQTLVRQRDEPWWPTPGPVEDQPSRSRGLRGQAYEARAANF
ncbi:MAG: hypothetical protein ACREMZ_15915, partial [Gemmatimonadales bacterium]